MYTALGMKRLSDFISAAGGLYEAAMKLNVYPSTLEKILQGRELSKLTRQKIEDAFGTITGPAPRTTLPQRGAIDTEASSSIIGNLRSFIKECGSIPIASIRLGVRISTLEKLLAGTSVSFHSKQKIGRLLNDRELRKASIAYPASMVERLTKVHVLYKEHGTLEAVGREMGLTRERVRQLLVKGSRLGLFEYKPFTFPYVPKEKLIADYTHFLSLSKVAQINKISPSYLRKLMTAYSITHNELDFCAKEARKARCVEQYNRIMDKLGHHPTTTELQATSEGHTLHTRINRLWGSIDAFRQELNIPKPPQGSRSFREDTRRWREQRQRLAFIVRMQHLDLIRECLAGSGPLAASQIVYECNLRLQRVWKLLGLLMATGEVTREGKFGTTKYRLVSD